jgi:hypothetical protein
MAKAMESGLKPLMRFAYNLEPKVVKRMAYGFRDDAYFFLRIRVAFPGIP